MSAILYADQKKKKRRKREEIKEVKFQVKMFILQYYNSPTKNTPKLSIKKLVILFS